MAEAVAVADAMSSSSGARAQEQRKASSRLATSPRRAEAPQRMFRSARACAAALETQEAALNDLAARRAVVRRALSEEVAALRRHEADLATLDERNAVAALLVKQLLRDRGGAPPPIVAADVDSAVADAVREPLDRRFRPSGDLARRS